MTFVADGGAPSRVDPCEGHDHPAVAARVLGAVHAAAGDSARDASLAQVLPKAFEIAALVSIELAGTLALPSPALANR